MQTNEPGPDLEGRIVDALRRIMRALDLHSRRLAEVCGLTGPQLALLQEARRSEPTTPSALARRLHLSTPTVTGILNRLEKRGLVARARGETDRRTIAVRVTAAGRRVIADAPSLLQDRLRAELARLAPWERSMTLAGLQRVAAMMGADDLEPGEPANGVAAEPGEDAPESRRATG